MEARKALRKAHVELKELHSTINSLSKDYVAQLESNNSGMYVTTHALVRFAERVKGISLLGDTDELKLSNYQGSIADLRGELLSPEDGRAIILGHKRFHHMRGYTIVSDGLTVLTVQTD